MHGRLGGAQGTVGMEPGCVPSQAGALSQFLILAALCSSPWSVSMGTAHCLEPQENEGEAQPATQAAILYSQAHGGCVLVASDPRGELGLLRFRGKCQLRWNSQSSLYFFQNFF